MEKLNIYENDNLIGQDIKDQFGFWTHRRFDYGSKKFRNESIQGRMINLYYSVWEYKKQ